MGCLVGTWRRLRPALDPKLLSDLEWFDIQVVPPGDFVTGLVQLLVMITAEWYRELIADLETQSARLRET